MLHPGAAAAARRWPPERFAEVGRLLAETLDIELVITGGPGEAALAAWVAERCTGRTAVGLDIGRLCDLVADADLVLCGDTGIAHLASAVGTPSVVLFGPVSPHLWGPPAEGHHTVLWHGQDDHSGDPHGTTTDPSLLSIQVPEVMRAALDRLGRTERVTGTDDAIRPVSPSPR